MSIINIMRTDKALPENLESARDLLFGSLDGFNRDDKKAWRSFWKRLIGMEPGEMALVEAVMEFLREGHAARFLWRHLGDGADEMMESILSGFDE